MSRWRCFFSYRSGRSPIFSLVLLTLILTLPTVALASTIEEPSAPIPPPGESGWRVDMDWGEMPLYFVANQGLTDEVVAYYVDGRDKTLYFSSQGVTFALSGFPREESASVERWAVKLDYLGANAVMPHGADATGAVVSYFSGSPEDWQAGLPTYHSIVYEGLWAGIDLAYSGSTDQLKQEFLLQPGADPAQIRLAYRGADVTLADEGELVISTPAGSFTDAAPIAYQEIGGRRVAVPVEFTLDSTAGEGRGAVTEYGFSLGAYDGALPLIIDPALLVYCGYVGGDQYDEGQGIAIDNAGCAYVVGSTQSTAASFPVAVGPDLVHNNSADAFIAKVNAAGTALVYCGYIGGTADDRCDQVAVDSSGCAYICGQTTSNESTFPVLVGPDLTKSVDYDVFVAKVNEAGTALVYCGYIGGAATDYGGDVAVDSSGCAYVTGHVYSSETSFPVVGGPDLTYGGNRDAFIAKVNAAGSGLVYCGYIGGTEIEAEANVAVDSLGRAYVAGVTNSDQTSFPVKVGPDLTHNGDSDAYVARVNAAGTAFDYCGYIGGASADQCYDVVVDSSGNAYVSGDTKSNESTFPVKACHDLSYNGGTDAFVAKINSGGTALVYCGYIGGDDIDEGRGIAIDSTGAVYLCGSTSSNQSTFPVKGGPSLIYTAFQEAFVAKLNPAGTSLELCGYMGGGGSDYGKAVAADDSGNLYVAGYTVSSWGFPLLVGPDLTNAGNGEAFVAKIDTALTRYQQDDPKITYLGDWATTSTWSASGGSYASTDQAGAVVSIEFTGPAVELLFRTAPWYGEAQVILDRGTVAEEGEIVDLYSPTVGWKVQGLFSKTDLDPGTHTLTIEHSGEKHASSAGTSISLDAVDIAYSLDQAPTTTRIPDEDTDYVAYGPAWSRWDYSGYWAAHNDTYAFTDEEGYQAAITFVGTHLSWVSRYSNTQGKALVTLDPGTPGTQTTVVDLYSPSTTWKKRVYSTGILTNSSHTVVIECLGEKNPSSWWYTVGVDAFDILGTPVTPAPTLSVPTRYQQDESEITYLGDWTTASSSSASKGSYASTGQQGAAALVRFIGTEVSVLASMGPDCGEVDIYVDDAYQDTVDLYSPSPVWKVPIYSDTFSPGDRILALECTGDKNVSSSGIAVNLDSVEVLGTLEQADIPTRIDDNDGIYVTYAPAWSRWDSSGYWAAYMDTYAFIDQGAYTATVTFYGTHLSWVSRKANTQGEAEVRLYEGSVDPEHLVSTQTIDLYSPSTTWKKRVYSTGLLPQDIYNVVIECKGTKNPASWWYTIGVDAFDIMEAIP